MLAVFIRALFGFYCRRARHYGIDQTQCGAATFVQRFGSALNRHVHLHVLCIDGVYAPKPDGTPEFFTLRPPENSEVAALVTVLAERIPALLKRRGLRPSGSRGSLAGRCLRRFGLRPDRHGPERGPARREGMLAMLRPRVREMIFTKAEGRRSKDPAELAALWPGSHVTGSAREAVELARSGFNPGDTVVVCGSLYLVGEARSVLVP